LHFLSSSAAPQFGHVREGSGSGAAAFVSAARSSGPESSIETIVRYFGGAGVGVGASSRITMPAGVRSDSMGVVSGVGGAGAGVPFSAT